MSPFTPVVYLLVTVCTDDARQDCQLFAQHSWTGVEARQECTENRRELLASMPADVRKRVTLTCYAERMSAAGGSRG